MVTRARVGITRPNPRYAGHVSTISPLPRSLGDVFRDPNWQNSMCDGTVHLLKTKLGFLYQNPQMQILFAVCGCFVTSI